MVLSVIVEVVGYEGNLIFDNSKPDGTPRKVLDCGKSNKLGWQPRIPLREGLERTYKWFLQLEETAHDRRRFN